MLDSVVLLSLEGHMPPQPPAVAEERVFQSGAGAVAERLGRKLTAAYDVQADQWLERLDRIKAELELRPTSGLGSPAQLSHISALIDEYETHAELRATGTARLEKRVRRDVKALFKVDPSIGAALRDVGQRLNRTDRRIVEALLDYALFLRAIRAEADPESRGGPVFDDPAALARHLDSLADA